MNTAAIASPLIHASQKRRKNTWYSIADGNWTDSNIWRSNALSYSNEISNTYPRQLTGTVTPIFPQIGDDVYIGHSVTYDSGTFANNTLNNIYVSGSLLCAGITRTINVKGDIIATGFVNFTGGAITLNLFGVNNSIPNAKFTAGTISTINYVRSGDQPVMDIPYRHLGIQSVGTKTAYANLVTLGNLVMTSTNSILEVGTYDVTIGGTSTLGDAFTGNATLSKSGAGAVILVGLLTAFNSNATVFNFSGNPTVECRGGLNLTNNNGLVFGTGAWSFTTNNQAIFSLGTNNVTFPTQVTIVGAITLTTQGASVSNVCIIRFTVNPIGTVAGSTLKNIGWLGFDQDPNGIMTTGVFDVTTVTGPGNFSLVYYYGGNYTLPKTSYGNFTELRGIGTKTLLGNTTFNGGLLIAPDSVLECSTFDLTVGSTFYIEVTNNSPTFTTGRLNKTTSGNIIFIGLFNVANAYNAVIGNTMIDFSGNPTVEFRAGIDETNVGSGRANFGNNVVFSTNNQNIKVRCGDTTFTTYFYLQNILISGAITVTKVNAPQSGIFRTDTINGNNASSKFTNQDRTDFRGTTQPMVTGLIDFDTSSTSIIEYNLAGNQDVRGGTYKVLELGTSGIKTLQGNVTVPTAGYSLTGTASLALNGFTLTLT